MLHGLVDASIICDDVTLFNIVVLENVLNF
jgi:hypothetical protein